MSLPTPFQVGTSRHRSRWCWCTGLPDTGLHPHIHLPLHLHTQRHGQCNNYTSYESFGHTTNLLFRVRGRTSRPQRTNHPSLSSAASYQRRGHMQCWNRWLWKWLHGNHKFQWIQWDTPLFCTFTREAIGRYAEAWIAGHAGEEALRINTDTCEANTCSLALVDILEKVKEGRVRHRLLSEENSPKSLVFVLSP